MPTIEIVSINSTGLGLNQADFRVAIIEDIVLESHRGLFYEFLKAQSGVIVHIGNPDMKRNKNWGFFAGKIVDWDFEPDDEADRKAKCQQRFKFLKRYIVDIDKLLKIALDNSPVSKMYFLTDYQFGPKKGKMKNIITISDFWIQHNSEGLHLNTLYELGGR